MRRCCLAAVTLMVLAVGASAQSPLMQPGAREFLQIYFRYADGLRTDGSKGLKDLLAPDFRILGDQGWVRGSKALAAIDQYSSLFRGGALSVRLRQVRIAGNQAVVMTREDGTVGMPIPGALRNPAPGVNVNSAKLTMSWTWKQTWRKTPQGWRLAQMEQAPNKVKDDDAVYTVTAGR